MSLSEKLIHAMHEAVEVQGGKIFKEVTDGSVLLETGLDSLGFAILVTKLEEELGYDPFVVMDEPYYPRTFGEFIMTYESNAPKDRL